MTTAVEKVEKAAPDSLAVALRDNPITAVGMMLQAAIDKGVTTENVTAVEKMMGLFEKLQDKKAEQEFDDAFALLQSEMQHVRATKPVENMYKYATYEEIMGQVQPLLTKHKFAVSFDTTPSDNKITVDCILSRRGHKRKNSYTCRIGLGRKGMSEPQTDGAAATTAQRNALCDCLNIVINHSDDKRNLGSPITPAQAASLKQRVATTGSDEKKFLKWAGAATFELIKNEVYGELDAELSKRESTR